MDPAWDGFWGYMYFTQAYPPITLKFHDEILWMFVEFPPLR